MEKITILALLTAFVKQRPGFELGNYGSWASYRADYRRVNEDRKLALALIEYINHNDGITADHIIAELRGRLTLENDRLEYCTGQYFPIEYRAAVCRALISVIWDHIRNNAVWHGWDGDKIRAAIKRLFGARCANLYT